MSFTDPRFCARVAIVDGLRPGRTNMSAFMLAIEGDLDNALYKAGMRVQNVYLPEGGSSNIGTAASRPGPWAMPSTPCNYVGRLPPVDDQDGLCLR